MADNKPQQKSPQAPEVTRLAVSISKGEDGRWRIEDLRLAGDKVSKAIVLTTLDGTKGVRVVAGTFSVAADDRLQEWQKEGLLK